DEVSGIGGVPEHLALRRDRALEIALLPEDQRTMCQQAAPQPAIVVASRVADREFVQDRERLVEPAVLGELVELEEAILVRILKLEAREASIAHVHRSVGTGIPIRRFS